MQNKLLDISRHKSRYAIYIRLVSPMQALQLEHWPVFPQLGRRGEGSDSTAASSYLNWPGKPGTTNLCHAGLEKTNSFPSPQRKKIITFRERT